MNSSIKFICRNKGDFILYFLFFPPMVGFSHLLLLLNILELHGYICSVFAFFSINWTFKHLSTICHPLAYFTKSVTQVFNYFLTLLRIYGSEKFALPFLVSNINDNSFIQQLDSLQYCHLDFCYVTATAHVVHVNYLWTTIFYSIHLCTCVQV